jgi:Peptidase M50B-like
MKNLLFRTLVMVVIYGVLKFMGGTLGRQALYPVTLLVTFLHEFGHAIGALITGGKVVGIEINMDGSGKTTSIPGSLPIIMMGGYLGSAIFGNLLFYIGAKRSSWAQPTLVFLAGLMVFSAIVWRENMVSSGILIVFAAILFFIAHKTSWDKDVLMFLGLAAILYIIEDFNVGPSSDLAQFEAVVGGSQTVWMYVWLAFAGGLFLFNLRIVFGNMRASSILEQ